MPREKINVVTLGCSKNTVDSERLLRQIQANKFSITSDAEKADTVIINTCGFIEAAKEESIAAILEAVKLKEQGVIKKVVVAGCLSERYKSELEKEIPGADVFFGTEAYEGIIRNLGGELKTELLGERQLGDIKHYAYLKISEGCDNPCSFCAIPLMRGKHRSRPLEELIKETEFLAAGGAKEIIIIGQDTTDYGLDIHGKRTLGLLLRKVSEVNGVRRVRLMYAYPSHFPDEVIDEIADNPRICKYIDIPLQHITDNCLKSMRRGITRRRTIELLDSLKKRIPGLTLRTTFILGYPSETEEDFRELCSFVSEYKFHRAGVFSYSVEENTPAFILGDPVKEKEKNRRKNELMEIQQEISHEYNQQLLGKEIEAIIDRLEGEFYVGRTYRDAPEVDGEVLVPAKGLELHPGDFISATVYDCSEYDLFANFDKLI